MAVIWPSGNVAFPTGDNALHLVAVMGDGEDEWDGTVEGIATADWLVVDGVGDYTRSNTSSTTPHSMFGRAAAVSTLGAPDSSITLNGWRADGDAGQTLLRSAQEGRTVIGYMNIRDRNVGDGYAVSVRVGGGDETQNAEGGLQPVSFTLAPQSDPVTVSELDTDPA